MAISAPLTALGTLAVATSDKMATARIGFETLLGSADKAGEFITDLANFAKRTPFDFPGLQDAAQRMLALGFASKEIIPTLTAIGDAVGQLGGGQDKIDRIVLAFGQMQGKRRVMTQEMNQLTEQGVKAWQYLADAISKAEGRTISIADVMKMTEGRMLDGATAVRIISAAMEKDFGGGMEKVTKLVTGQMSNLRDAVLGPGGPLDQLGQAMRPMVMSWIQSLTGMIPPINAVIMEFRTWSPAIQQLILGFAAFAVAIGPVTFALSMLSGVFGPLIGIMGSMITAVPAVTAVIGNLTFAVESGLIGALSAGEIALLGFGTAALVAAAGFAGWQLAEWAEETFPTFAAEVRNSIVVLRAMYPVLDTIAAGLQKIRDFASGGEGMKAPAAPTADIQNLVNKLKDVDIYMVQGAQSSTQFAVAVRTAAVSAGILSGDAARSAKTIEELGKQLLRTSGAQKELRETAAEMEQLAKEAQRLKEYLDDLETTQLLNPEGAGKFPSKQGVLNALIDQMSMVGPAAEEMSNRTQEALELLSAAVEQRVMTQEQALGEWVRILAQLRSAAEAAAGSYTRALNDMQAAPAPAASIWARAADAMDPFIQKVQKIPALLGLASGSAQGAAVALLALGQTGQRAGQDFGFETIAQQTERLRKLEEEYARAISARAETATRSGLKHIDLDRMQRAILEAQIKLMIQMGETGSEAYRTARQELERLNSSLGKTDEALKGIDEAHKRSSETWKRMTQQISTVVNDFAKTVAESFIGIFKNNNEALEREAADLSASLADRTEEWEKYVTEVTSRIAEITANHTEAMAREQEDVRAALAEKEQDYADYATEIAGRLEDVRRSHAEKLADELADLQRNLAERAEAYAEYVADANQKLARIGEDLAETLSDQSRSTKRKQEDENSDFARDQERNADRMVDAETKRNRERLRENTDYARDIEDLNADLREAQAKGDNRRAEEIRRQIQRRIQDHAQALRRIEEDYANETAALKIELAQRTAAHRTALDRIQQDADEAADDAKRNAERQTADVHTELGRRAADFAQYQGEIQRREQEAITSHAAAQRKQEEDLKTSLADRQAALERYRADAAQKLEDITTKHKAQQDKELADLNKAFDDKRAAYDKYVLDTQAKLKQLEDEHKGLWGRIGDAMKTAVEQMATGFLRIMLEQAFDPLKKAIIDWAKDAFTPILDAIRGVFGGLPSDRGIPGGTPGSAPGPSGGQGGGQGGGAGDFASGANAFFAAFNAVYQARQGRHQSYLLGEIEKFTRYTSWLVMQTDQNNWQRHMGWMTKIDQIQNKLWEQFGWLWAKLDLQLMASVATNEKLDDLRNWIIAKFDTLIDAVNSISVRAGAATPAGSPVIPSGQTVPPTSGFPPQLPGGLPTPPVPPRGRPHPTRPGAAIPAPPLTPPPRHGFYDIFSGARGTYPAPPPVGFWDEAQQAAYRAAGFTGANPRALTAPVSLAGLPDLKQAIAGLPAALSSIDSLGGPLAAIRESIDLTTAEVRQFRESIQSRDIVVRIEGGTSRDQEFLATAFRQFTRQLKESGQLV